MYCLHNVLSSRLKIISDYRNSSRTHDHVFTYVLSHTHTHKQACKFYDTFYKSIFLYFLRQNKKSLSLGWIFSKQSSSQGLRWRWVQRIKRVDHYERGQGHLAAHFINSSRAHRVPPRSLNSSSR